MTDSEKLKEIEKTVNKLIIENEAVGSALDKVCPSWDGEYIDGINLLANERDILKEECKRLKSDLGVVETINDLLKVENSEVDAENKRLKAENAELREERDALAAAWSTRDDADQWIINNAKNILAARDARKMREGAVWGLDAIELLVRDEDRMLLPVMIEKIESGELTPGGE